MVTHGSKLQSWPYKKSCHWVCFIRRFFNTVITFLRDYGYSAGLWLLDLLGGGGGTGRMTG